MSEYTLNADTLRLIALFENYTHSRVRDVVEEEDRLTFVIEEGYLGKAIGKGAANLKQLRDILKKEVDVVGYDSDRQKFLGNLFHRFKVDGIVVETRRDGKEVAKIAIDQADRGKAIGKGGRNINLMKTIAERHHGISDISLVEASELSGEKKPQGPREGGQRGGPGGERRGDGRRGGRGGRGRGGDRRGGPRGPRDGQQQPAGEQQP
ncbi:MAG TPA: NusA-like transcription termination signal-binding factor, partial [Candidatus Thermoplasmatota archaeon]|nr:NusA-like transcription termination signal-binding factor [Candidatus Thermoplasmatota archaeon]